VSASDPVTDELAQIVRRLPEGQQEVVLLRFVDDLSLEEIAQALEIPLGTVKSRLHHAISTLRTDPATRAYSEKS
jgi:RNA polymerase sigma-70 factor, ECF subfamily